MMNAIYYVVCNAESAAVGGGRANFSTAAMLLVMWPVRR